MSNKQTEQGWDAVAQWYDKLVGDGGSDYHKNVILPALLRLLENYKGKKVIDVCCGQGFLGNILLQLGVAEVHGVDASETLIISARNRAKGNDKLQYTVADACEKDAAWANGSYDAAVCLLAVHDAADAVALFTNVSHALAKHGKAYIVMMHPCFRIPRQTHWGWDEQRKIQYRRLDRYASPLAIPITTHPGKNTGEKTVFHHRSLADVMNALGASGLAVTHCDELVTHRRSQAGPRSRAEHRAAVEFPMFLLLEAVRVF